MGGPYEKTTPFPFPSERFPQGIAPSYLADLTYETAVAAKVLADAILEAKSDDTAEILAARAILAAEQRGAEREREPCEQVADELYRAWYSSGNFMGDGFGDGARNVAAEIAAAIRNRGTEND